MTWQWIEDFVMAAVCEAEMRRRTVEMDSDQAARFLWASVHPAGKA